MSAARGAMRLRATSRTRSRISRCSSVSRSAGTARVYVEARGSPAVVTDRLDVVPVGIEHEGAVVARVVLGTLAGRAVVAVPGGDCDAVELVHGRVVRRGEADVRVPRGLSRHEPENAAGDAEADDAFRLVSDPEAQRCQDRGIEALRRLEVVDAQGNVVDRAFRRLASVLHRLDVVP